MIWVSLSLIAVGGAPALRVFFAALRKKVGGGYGKWGKINGQIDGDGRTKTDTSPHLFLPPQQ